MKQSNEFEVKKASTKTPIIQTSEIGSSISRESWESNLQPKKSQSGTLPDSKKPDGAHRNKVGVNNMGSI